MEFLLDNPESENNFQQLLSLINLRKNGETAALLKNQELNTNEIWVFRSLNCGSLQRIQS